MSKQHYFYVCLIVAIILCINRVMCPLVPRLYIFVVLIFSFATGV